MEQLAILLLGSNLGDRYGSLEKAAHFLCNETGKAEGRSSVYESAPWGKTDQPRFLNQVITIRTSLDPFTLLAKCLDYELSTGRVRKETWGPRSIDIDILYYGEQIIDSGELRVPHPGIPLRRFTLVPLCELHPAMQHPESGKTHLQMLESCPDPGEVKLYDVHE